MELLVFCRLKKAYRVPKWVIKKVEMYDIEYDKGNLVEESQEFIKMIEEKYKPIPISYLLTGDLG